ncbi:hypothetical protein QQ045_016611 [Rhodiola kirilowii]
MASVIEPRLGTTLLFIPLRWLDNRAVEVPSPVAAYCVFDFFNELETSSDGSLCINMIQIFAIAQKECVDSFFSQNSFISYDALHKLAIPQPAQYLQIRYHEGILLDTLFVHPSMVGMLNFAADDVIEYGTWFDALSVLPTSFGLQDASNFLSLCPSVNTSLKDLFTRLEKEMETISFSVSAIDHHTLVKEAKGGHELGRSTMMGNANENGNKLGHEKVSEKKKGKSAANAKNSAAEVSLDNQNSAPTK